MRPKFHFLRDNYKTNIIENFLIDKQLYSIRKLNKTIYGREKYEETHPDQ